MNSDQLLQRNAFKYPNNEAVICMGRRVTYEALNQQVNQFAHSLRESGVKQGNKVVLFMPNVLEFVVSYYAVQRLGGIIVPISAKLTTEEVNYVVDHSNASAFIGHELLFAIAEHIDFSGLKIKTGTAATGWESYERLVNREVTSDIICTLTDDDEASILYTSGTTGRPKGVLFSYRNILTVAQMICVEMEMKPESRVLLMMPLSHSAPLHLFLMGGMIVGATFVLTPTFTPELLIETVEKEQTTHFFGAPVAYLLAAQLPQIKEADLSSMKWWVYGGSGLSKEEVQHVQAALQTKDLVCVYGLTEAGPSGSLLLKEEHETNPGSIGRRAPLHTELRIVNDAGVDVDTNEIGEIILRGDGNMLGYYDNKSATEETFMGEWLKTGDLARRDENGYIYVVDRKDDLIITGGVNVYPKEVEDVLLQHPLVNEVAVIGVKDKQWGEKVKAFVVGKEPLETEVLQSFLKDHVSSSKVPRAFEQVDVLPRNAAGKVLKHMLKASE